jgi:hypothetical protein
MKKHLLITSVLAFGMGIAGAQSQPTTPAPMQGGTGDARGAAQQSPRGGAGQATGDPISSQTATQSFEGCLNGSPGSWSLTSDKGKNLTLTGSDDKLSQYKGQVVRVQGIQATDGTVKIDSIEQVSSSCPNQSSSNMGEQNSTTDQNSQSSQASTSSTTSTAQSTATTQPDSTGAASQSATSGASPGAATTSVTSQTPANTVGSGQTDQPASQNSSTSTTVQPSTTAQQRSTSNADQSSASSSTATSNQTTADQSNSGAASADQTANHGVKRFSDMDQNTSATDQNASAKLPQTASPLPLLGLLGLGSLAAGLISRRK